MTLLLSDVERWFYLKDINLPCIDGDVKLLIGSDVPKALELQEVQKSEDGGAYAVQTLLGWTINGPLGKPSKSSSIVKLDPELRDGLLCVGGRLRHAPIEQE